MKVISLLGALLLAGCTGQVSESACAITQTAACQGTCGESPSHCPALGGKFPSYGMAVSCTDAPPECAKVTLLDGSEALCCP